MFAQLLPSRADNGYRGHKLALVLYGLLLLAKTAISLGSIFNGRTAAASADGIPIDTPPGFSINLVMLGVMIVGLALSLWTRRSGEAMPAAEH